MDAALNGEEPVGIPWLTIVAFVRIATNARIYHVPLSIGEARSIVDEWLARENVAPVTPGPNHWNIFGNLLVEGKAAAGLVTDAHLAAMAIENGATLITTDRDFARFPGLHFRAP